MSLSLNNESKKPSARVTKINNNNIFFNLVGSYMSLVFPYKLAFNFGTAEDVLVTAFVRFWPFGVLV